MQTANQIYLNNTVKNQLIQILEVSVIGHF